MQLKPVLSSPRKRGPITTKLPATASLPRLRREDHRIHGPLWNMGPRLRGDDTLCLRGTTHCVLAGTTRCARGNDTLCPRGIHPVFITAADRTDRMHTSPRAATPRYFFLRLIVRRCLRSRTWAKIPPRRIRNNARCFSLFATAPATRSSGSSTRSSGVGARRRAATRSRRTTPRSSGWRRHGCGCALPSPRPRVDQLVRASQQRRRDVEPDGLCGFEVDDQPGFGRLPDGKVGGFCVLGRAGCCCCGLGRCRVKSRLIMRPIRGRVSAAISVRRLAHAPVCPAHRSILSQKRSCEEAFLRRCRMPAGQPRG